MTLRKSTIAGVIFALIIFLLNIRSYWWLESEYKINLDGNLDLALIPLFFLNLLIGSYAIFIYFLLPITFGLLFSKTIRTNGRLKELRENFIVILLATCIVAALFAILQFGSPKLFPLSFENTQSPQQCGEYASDLRRNTCYGGEAVKLVDTSLCDKSVDPFQREICYSNVALLNKKPEICNQITTSPNFVTYCKAQASRDPLICDRMLPKEQDPSFTSTPQECKKHVADRIKYDQENPLENK
ncbi:MAG: hypothetical protein O3A36_01420 [bacterium]|nr:hypothetical protein [bacterium]